MKKNDRLRHRVRVLPLGDSLTQGDGNPSAYRYDLFRLYTEADIPFVYVGGVLGNDHRMPPEYDRHSGRCGATSENLIAYMTEGDPAFLPAWADAVREAEVVLLYIGTNDSYRHLPVGEFADRLFRLIDLLYSLRSDLVLYIATLRSKSALSEEKLAINRAILAIDSEEYCQRTGREVHIVDFNAPGTPRNLPSDYPPDDAHPAAEGNRKLAEMWYRATARRLHELSLTLPPERLGAPPAGMMTNLKDVTLAPGTSTVFRAQVMPADVRVPSLAWCSSDPRVAEVDESGRVSARAPGRCEITVESLLFGLSRTAIVTVAGEPWSAMAGRSVLFSDGERHPEWFLGTTDVVMPDHRQYRFRWPHQSGELTTHEALAVDGGFCLSFDYRHVPLSQPIGATSRFSFTLGGIMLTFGKNCGQITLSSGERLLAEVALERPSFLFRHYDLVATDARLTLYLEGEPLCDVLLDRPPVASPLSLSWADRLSVDHLRALTVGK